MRKRATILAVAAFFAISAIGASTAEARGGRGRGGFAVAPGGVFVSTSTGGFNGAAWSGPSTGVAVSVGAGQYVRGRGGYGRHHRYRAYRAWPGRHSRGYGRYGHSGAGVSISFAGPRGQVAIHSGPGRAGYGQGYGHGYGRRPIYGGYGYGYGYGRPATSYGITVTVPAGSTLPYMSRVWVPGRLTDLGYSAGYWDMRSLRKGPR
jgi:hypothetical protein